MWIEKYMVCFSVKDLLWYTIILIKYLVIVNVKRYPNYYIEHIVDDKILYSKIILI